MTTPPEPQQGETVPAVPAVPAGDPASATPAPTGGGAAASPRRPAPLGGPFHRFWAATVATNLGDGVLATVLPLVAATLTHDPLAVSGLLVARYLPWLLLGPFSGVLLDRVDRLRAMAVSTAVSAVTIAGLAVAVAAGQATLWVLYAAMFLVMSCETVTDPASRLLVTRVVARDRLDRANGRMEGGRLVVQDCLGSPVGGLLFAVAAVAPVAGAAGAYALCAVLVLGLVPRLRRSGPVPGAEDAGAGPGDGAPRRSAVEDLVGGFRYVFGHGVLRRLMVANAGMMIGIQMGMAVLVLFARDELGVPAALYGLFVGGIAVGGLLGSALTARLVTALGRRAVMMAGYLGVAAAAVAMGLSPHALVALPAWAFLGFCLAVSNIAGSPYFQVVVPVHVRGRASTVFRTVGWGLSPVGAFLGGLLGRIDLALPFVAGGLVMAVAVLHARHAVADAARACDEAAEADGSGNGGTHPRAGGTGPEPGAGAGGGVRPPRAVSSAWPRRRRAGRRGRGSPGRAGRPR
ncbi:MFS transporter [Streptomonospora nanhaiensis]|uniref:MFS transporter n=1 Tax=Streptomonospora nanhaiensis TaxID=1323731 RepID=A0ABY6YSL4_9ACTN|nr:MFS transporter [Streptomonospora nanhaiensis]WAE75334.1 MFS transporter [Streptomonospora nanhaiensis]